MSTKAAHREKITAIPLGNITWDTTLAAIRADRVSLDELIKLADGFQQAGDIQKLDLVYSTWIKHSTAALKFVACFNYGVILANAGREDEAIAQYQLAIKLNPGFAHPRVNLGLAYERKGWTEQAIDEWNKVATDPQCEAASLEMKTTALNHVGRLLEQLREYDRAERALSESLKLNPEQTDALHHWFHLRQKQCKWPAEQTDIPGVYENSVLRTMSPLACLAYSDDPAFQMFVGNRIVKEKFIFPQNITPLADRASYGHSKIRIGYLSGDLCSHAVGFLMPEIFELHDRERFEIYAYDYSKEDGTHTRLRIKHSTEHFTSIQNLTDQQAANKIRQDEIDILVDLHGLSQGLRPGILAQRPARVQMTYLGYIGTTMMPYLDYVITDKYCFNGDLAKYYSERPLLLDRCCIPTDRKRLVSEVPSKASQGLPEDKFIFATFNNAYKMNRPMFSSWMRILQQVPNSILWIVEDNPWAGENLKQEAARSGVDISRLIFAQRVIPPEYLARMKLVDLFLDNHPYNAGSTASDIAWMGAPMITLSGKTFVSRMAGSILHHSGLSGLITHSYEQYEALAITLSSRPDLLQAIKLQLAQQHAEGGAFDMKLFTRDLEEKYLSSLV